MGQIGTGKAVLTLALAMLVTACSGQPPLTKQRLETSKDTQSLLDSLDGPEVPTIESALLKSARQAEAGGQHKKAAQFYAQLVDKNPENDRYRFNLAESLRRVGAYPAAVASYEKVKDKPEYKAAALEGIGLSLMAQGEYDKAGDHLAEVMEIDAARWRTINAIGILFTIRAMYPEARQYFAEAQVVAPGNASVYNNTALMEALDKNYKDAERLFSEALSFPNLRKDEREQLAMNLALVYAIQGNLERAEKTAKPFLTEAQLYNNMGYYAHLADDDRLAKSYLNMALTKSPRHYDRAWQNLDTLDKLIKNAPKGNAPANPFGKKN